MVEPRRKAATDPIDRILRRTRAVMLLERLARAFWPLGSLLVAAWALLAFGLTDWLGPGELAVAVGAVGLAALYLAYRGLRACRWPRRAEVLARLDRDLPGRPLAALADRQAIGRGDPGAAAVWAAHLRRMRKAARAARVPRPDPRLASRDPWALRLMALVLFLAALIFARGDGIGALGQALTPPRGPAVAQGPSFDGWAEPPAYTGMPTLYLPEVPGDRPVELPEGTEITLRVYGGDEFALSESVSGAKDTALAAAAEGITGASFPVARSGSVTLRRGERALGAWSFIMRPDAAPEIELTEPVDRAVGGEMQLAYTARDDYGVTAARAEITLDLARVERKYGLAAEPAPREPLSIDLPLPVSGGGAEISEMLVEDFSEHPWVGLPIRITLIAEDALDQEGRREGIAAELPGRRFFDPVAAALIEQRRDLLWSPENLRRVMQVLRAVTWRPEQAWDSPRAYLVTRSAIRRLARAEDEGRAGAVVPEVARMLWHAALLIEEGGLGDAAERLARAQERLREALRNEASEEEIAQLMDELREATRDYMEQLAREAIERGETQQAQRGEPRQEMTQDQIQRLMDRIQELSEQGRRAEAEQLLEMLRQMLENMEMRLAEGGEGQGGQGQQALEDLANALREQQQLADDSFQELQRQFQQNRQGRSGQPGQPGQPHQGGEGRSGPGPGALAERQEALRQSLEDLQGGLPGSANEAGEAAREALREAERQMAEARDRLGRGDTTGALDDQADAMERMREGMQGMAEEMRQAQGGNPGGAGQDGEAEAQGRSDPLGRPTGAHGNVGTNESMVPEADARARALMLLDEIRRRVGDQSRPDLELDYLKRLLDRF